MKISSFKISLIATTSVAVLFVMLSFSCTWLKNTFSTRNYRSPEAVKFWRWFSENKNRFSEITDENDARLKEIGEKLKSIDPKLDFKIGYSTKEFRAIGSEDNPWVPCIGKQKKHLLSITSVQCDKRACHIAQTLIHDAEFPGIERKCHTFCPQFVQLDSNWCASSGYHPYSSTSGGATYSAKESISINSEKIRFKACFNQDSKLVDVTLCSDTAFRGCERKIDGDSILSIAINQELEGWLGTFDYVNSLGDVFIEQNCEDSKPVGLIHNEFYKLRSKENTDWFNKKLVLDPSKRSHKKRIAKSWSLCPYRPSLNRGEFWL